MASSSARSASSAPALRATIIPAAAWADAEGPWSALFEETPGRSFFQSPAWVGSWLEVFGAGLDARIVVFDDAGTPVGAAVLAFTTRRRGPVPVRQLLFHTTGEPDADAVAVEYAAPLARAGDEDAVLAATGAMARDHVWDELVLAGVPETVATALAAHCADSTPDAEVERRPTYLVDLAALRASGARYESVLSKNTRDQLRRSLKLYRERGEPTVHIAATRDDASAMFGELHHLHQARWEARGARGAFASSRWRTFHERLIDRAFPRGGIQFVRVSSGADGETIGLLYNFVDDRTVSFYQSGFRYETDNRLRPGTVTHALTIETCLARGFDTYDFLASGTDGSRYKASLSTRSETLAWCVLRRPTVRNRTVDALRRVTRLVRPRT